MSARPRAIVVGATFGAVYAEALASPLSPVELVGVLSTGSASSADLAQRLGVALYTAADDLPPVDVGFVVVRAGVVGGTGTAICEQLLARGIHVMQEQPVHADEMVSLLRVAKANRVQYAVNDFYTRVAPVRQFVSAATALDAIAPIRYVHARCSIHVAYPLFAILGVIVGALTPSRLVAPRGHELTDGPFVAGRLVLGDVVVDLLVQHEMCASDPDNYARLMHAITVGSDAGELVLAHTHGPTRWHPRPRAEAATAPVLIAEPVGSGSEPTAVHVRDTIWPDAVRCAATDFVESVRTGRPLMTQRFLRAARLWSEFTSAMGPVTLIDPQPPQYVSADQLACPFTMPVA